eukprot:Tamp_25401.p1 GENE.Tamp_25401~~Tamp_25401.p1  ORF type:complete len:273 (+),score=57.05 Tamp_25401:95-913(+)
MACRPARPRSFLLKQHAHMSSSAHFKQLAVLKAKEREEEIIESGLTEELVMEQIHEMQDANRAIEEEIKAMHTKLVEMGDPDERPIPRVELTNNVWIVEGYNDASHAVDVPCHHTQSVEILTCKGEQDLTTFHVSGTAANVLIENCQMVKVLVDAVLYDLTLINCQDCVVVIGAEAPKVTVKHCVAVGLLLHHDKMDNTLECNSSAAVMLTSPSRDCLTSRVSVTVNELEKAGHFMACEIPSYINCRLVGGTWACDLETHRMALRSSGRDED